MSNEILFIPDSMDYDHEMVLKSKDWVKRLNPDNKLPNFNTRRILVPESQTARSYTQLRDVIAFYVKYIVQFDDKQGTIFNANKEIVLISPRRNDVYVLDMTSLSPNGACFFAKASESVNWLWHKRLSHLNFKNINKLAKQNKVLGLPSLVYSKDKPCSACEKRKHHRDSFKTKQNFSIRKWLHLIHKDLFGPVSPMSINHKKYTLVIVDEYSRGRIPDINYFHVFGCLVFIHNHKDHLGKFDAKADDGYFLGYSFVSKAFRVFNIRRQQIEETYHVTFDESMEAIRFTNTSVDEIGIDDSSRYPPDDFLHEDDTSRQYQVDSNVSYYIIPHGRKLIELTQEKHVPEVITPNEPDTSHIQVDVGPPDLTNTEGKNEQNDQDEQVIIHSIENPSGDNTEVLFPTTEPSVPEVLQSQVTHQASTISHPIPQDRWSKDQHIKLVNIIGDPGKGMLTRSMAAKLIAASANRCLFADFLFEIEPKKVSEGASCTQGTISSIPIVGSISPEGFLSLILLLVVIIATVVVTVVVVVIVGVVIVVAVIRVVVVVGVYVGKDGGTRIWSCFRDELDNIFEEEDGGWICFLGGNNFSGTTKYQGSNSSDGGNTEDGVKIACGEIGSGGGIEEKVHSLLTSDGVGWVGEDMTV
ncbi:retrovirus-related pol polyprotein from transposon TNT 1-94 [Tanacetum coccineum]